MEITTDDYAVWHDADTSTVFLKGLLRLDGIEAYQPIMDLLLSMLNSSSSCTVDLHELEFINSSGISMLSVFVVKTRQMGGVQLTIKGTNNILWQTRSLKNLQRLMPEMILEFS